MTATGADLRAMLAQRASPQTSTLVCSICCEEQSAAEMHSLACGHAWHKDCLRKFMEVRIESALSLTCLSCSCRVEADVVERLVCPKSYAKYCTHLKNMEVNHNPDLRWCPTPKCGSVLQRPKRRRQALLQRAAGLVATCLAVLALGRYMALPPAQLAAAVAMALVFSGASTCSQSGGQPLLGQALLGDRDGLGIRVVCKGCKGEFCFDCGAAWHPGQSCRQSEDQALWSWAAGRDVHSCPRCRNLIEKNAGCNHMTCRSCRHQFCWRCGGTWKSGHMCLSPVWWERICKQVRNVVAEPPWIPVCLAIYAALWSARCLRQLRGAPDGSVVDACGLAAIAAAGGAVALVQALAGARRWALCLVPLALVLAAALASLVQLAPWGPWGPRWGEALWVGNLLLAVQAWAVAQPAHMRHAFPPLRGTVPFFRGRDRAVWSMAPLLVLLLLQVLIGNCASTAPTLAPNATEVVAVATTAPPPSTLPAHFNLSSAFGVVRSLCGAERERNNSLCTAMLGLEAAAAERDREVADMQLRLKALEDRMSAVEPLWSVTALWGQLRKCLVHTKAILSMLVVLAGLLAHSVYCFMLFCKEDDLSTGYRVMPGRWALASARGLSLPLLLLQLAGPAKWPTMAAGVWWGARLFPPCLLSFLTWEVGDQLLAVPTFMALLSTLGLGALSQAGWPVDLLPMTVGGAIAAVLAADAAAPWLESAPMMGLRVLLRSAPCRVGVLLGALVWLGDLTAPHSAVAGVYLAGLTPKAAQVGLVLLRKSFTAPAVAA